GSPVQENDLGVSFDVELEAQNPNPFPLPLTHALFAFTAFPDEPDTSKLGAACLTFCKNPSSCPQDADACRSDEPEIKDISDFKNATQDFLIAMALGDRSLDDLRIRTIAPGDRLALVVRLGLAPTQVLNLLRKSARADLDQIKAGHVPEFSIPYSLEGT